MSRYAKFVVAFVSLLPISIAQQFPAKQLSDVRAFEVIFKEIRQSERHLAELGSKAAASELPIRYQALFSLSESDDRALRQTAMACLTETGPLDQQAAEIIRAIKSQYRPTVGLGRAGRVPPPPSELAALQEKKDETIRKHLSELERSMGRGGLAVLTVQVRRHVASHSQERKK